MSTIYISDIPSEAIENVVSFYAEDENARETGGTIHYERREYILEDKVVGYRQFDHEGRLIIETAVKNNRKHGREYTWYWYDPNKLSLQEPYENGLVHGTATQWAIDGRLMGTYSMVHGSGYDIWRQLNDLGIPYIAEIHTLQSGKLHGYQWWLNEDQKTLRGERFWKEGFLHGIERSWTEEGLLIEGYPNYYIEDTKISQKLYIKSSRRDKSLPAYNKNDDKNVRVLPQEIFASTNNHNT